MLKPGASLAEDQERAEDKQTLVRVVMDAFGTSFEEDCDYFRAVEVRILSADQTRQKVYLLEIRFKKSETLKSALLHTTNTRCVTGLVTRPLPCILIHGVLQTV